ncbi:MAG: exo-alpha-sialidase [Saprospiraceae bacterium]
MLFLFLFGIYIQIAGQSSISFLGNSDTVEIFAPGVVSTFYNERDFALNSDHNLFCFSFASFDNKKRSIVFSKKESAEWSNPEVVSFSGLYDDLEPFFAPDTKKVFFASNRPLPGETLKGDYNIWYTELKDSLWTSPVALDTIINQEGDEFFPSVASNGNLYFTATRKDGIGKEDIFVAEFNGLNFSKPTVLPVEINTETYEFNAFINPEENLLIFSSYGRTDDLGGGDLYYSKKDENGEWTKSVHLPKPINSEKLDYCPFYDEDTQTLFFTSNRKGPENEENQSLNELKTDQTSILNGFGNIFKIKAKSYFTGK